MATLVGDVGLAPSASGGPAAASGSQPLFTCLSCAIAFTSAADQRAHYRADLHRYNMKRRVAGLPPVRAQAFNERVLERRKEIERAQQGNAGAASGADGEAATGKCAPCGKTFASANAYKDHLVSRKHRETLAKLDAKSGMPGKASSGATAGAATGTAEADAAPAPAVDGAKEQEQVPLQFRVPYSGKSGSAGAAEPAAADASAGAGALGETAALRDALPEASTSAAPARNTTRGLTVSEDATEEEIAAAVDAKIASAQSTRIDPSTTCLFCIAGPQQNARFRSLDETLAHMRRAHSFFLPEASFISDLPGLLRYLADKVSVGHMCLYCNGRGRGFASKEAAQRHMLDKGHCKVAYYESEEDMLELGDFYDFRASYPDAEAREARRQARKEQKRAERRARKEAKAGKWEVVEGDAEDGDEEVEWEDEDAEDVDGEADDAESDVSSVSSSESEDDDSDSDEELQARYGDNEYELVLPSGVRLGHRAMRRYYKQSLRPSSGTNTGGTGTNGGALARRLIGDAGGRRGGDGAESGALVVRGRNGGTIQARSKGQARELRRYQREFRDVQRKEQYKTRAAFANNNQKHFRDEMLQ